MFPSAGGMRAKVRAFAPFAREIHPTDNLRVLQHLTGPMGLSEFLQSRLVSRRIREEPRSTGRGRVEGPFCLGISPTIADLCLVPQLANARRAHCDVTRNPMLLGIEAHSLSPEAFRKVAAENQLPPLRLAPIERRGQLRARRWIFAEPARSRFPAFIRQNWRTACFARVEVGVCWVSERRSSLPRSGTKRVDRSRRRVLG